jgi:hypothetical protein
MRRATQLPALLPGAAASVPCAVLSITSRVHVSQRGDRGVSGSDEGLGWVDAIDGVVVASGGNGARRRGEDWEVGA